MFVEVEKQDKIAVLRMNRPKVNALNAELCRELSEKLDRLADDMDVHGVILTGLPGYFSAGLDVIDLYPRNRDYIYRFWSEFHDLLTKLFTYPKLIFSAISGHSPAGGTVLAIMTDYRIFAQGNYKIGLNEVAVGLVVPRNIGIVFRYLLGNRQAEKLAMTGALLAPDEALKVGLVDEVCEVEDVVEITAQRMKQWMELPLRQQNITKTQLRKTLIDQIRKDKNSDIKEIVEIWFSASGRKVMSALVEKLKGN